MQGGGPDGPPPLSLRPVSAGRPPPGKPESARRCRLRCAARFDAASSRSGEPFRCGFDIEEKAPGRGDKACGGPGPEKCSRCCPIRLQRLEIQGERAEVVVAVSRTGVVEAGRVDVATLPDPLDTVVLVNSGSEAADLAPFVAGADPGVGAQALVEHALTAGGIDNITVAVIPIGGPDEFS